MTSDAAEGRADRRLELAATLLLAIAAVATAWCTYQATRWNQEGTKQMSATTKIRIEAARAESLAETQVQVDLATFVQWVDAYARDETVLVDFYYKRFREEFKPAVDAWIATRPLRNPKAPLSPFAMPQYHLAARAEAKRFDAEDKISSALLRRDLQRASNYLLGVVLFAVALFLAAMSTKLESRRLRVVLLICGYVVLLSTAVWIATSPVTVAV
jgi:hypothetical protein